jgi:hypothetical protein
MQSFNAVRRDEYAMASPFQLRPREFAIPGMAVDDEDSHSPS